MRNVCRKLVSSKRGESNMRKVGKDEKGSGVGGRKVS